MPPDRIRALHAGRHPLSDRAAQKLFVTLREEAAAARAALGKLTARERETLLHLGEGPTPCLPALLSLPSLPPGRA